MEEPDLTAEAIVELASQCRPIVIGSGTPLRDADHQIGDDDAHTAE